MAFITVIKLWCNTDQTLNIIAKMHKVTKTNLEVSDGRGKIFVVVEAQHFHCTCGNTSNLRMVKCHY